MIPILMSVLSTLNKLEWLQAWTTRKISRFLRLSRIALGENCAGIGRPACCTFVACMVQSRVLRSVDSAWLLAPGCKRFESVVETGLHVERMATALGAIACATCVR